MRVEAALGSRVHEIDDEFDFWFNLAIAVHGSKLRDIMQSDARHRPFQPIEEEEGKTKRRHGFKHGDHVVLKGWYLSDWMPRIPGELWKQDLVNSFFFDKPNRYYSFEFDKERLPRIPDRIRSWVEGSCYRYPEGVAMAAGLPVYDWRGKAAIALSGVGSIRLPLNIGDADHFACLGAVTANSWLTDLGIPVVVSEQVFRDFDRARANRSVAVEADLRGRVVIGGIPDPFTHVPIAASADISSIGVDALLRRCTDLPVAYVHVITPLDCELPRAQHSSKMQCLDLIQM